MKKIEILKPTIFPSNIIAGITKKNLQNFPTYGFSIFPGKIYNDEEIINHRKELAGNIGINLKNLMFQRQVHQSHIRVIDENSEEIESDGMITSTPGLILNITIADCCAVLCYDTMNQAIGAFHSGWRGTKEKISIKGIDIMKDIYGSNPENMLVYLSPCASGENYEVGKDVAEYFPKSVKPIENNKYLLDIKNEIKIQLASLGIPDKNIEISNICTIENTEYHSYRRDKEKSGRMSAFIGISANQE